MNEQPKTTVSLSHKALSRLATLCDARAHNLRQILSDNVENFGNDLDEDEISDAESEITYLDGMAAMLREARNGR
jgi:hypothetical protein